MSAGPTPRVLTWLHVSDFHFEPTVDFEREKILEALVALVQSYQGGPWAPDLIFASGDIANRGADAEYTRAKTFFRALLDAAKLEVPRLIVVPGNHDVDRTQGVFLERTLADEAASDSFFKQDRNPDGLHPKKLRAFTRWYGQFLKKGHPKLDGWGSSPPMSMTIRDVTLGILPVNTALFAYDDSDHGKLWIGRSLLDRNAKLLLEKGDADLRLAVMHHPLDWLHDEERAQVKEQLSKTVDVILRGHLHENEVEATVSASHQVLHLAAGATYQHKSWPKRALFVRFDADKRTLRVHAVKYEPNPSRRWLHDVALFPDSSPPHEHTFELPKKGTARSPITEPPKSVRRNRAETQTRTWKIGADGVAEVTVELTSVVMEEPLVLATTTPPFCECIGAETAETTPAEAGGLNVQKRDLPDGRRRFIATGANRAFEHVKWSYLVSTACALHGTDRRLMGPRHHWFPNVDDRHDGRAHTVHIDSKSLTIVYEFADDVIESVEPRVERHKDPLHPDEWVPDTREEKKCKAEGKGRHATLNVPNPQYGHRYSLVYKLKQPGWKMEPDAQRTIDEVRKACRTEYASGRPAEPHSMLTSINTNIAKLLATVLEGGLGPKTSAIGLLWNDQQRLLKASFGTFANEAWAVRFPYGNGVAGHAFRFHRTAAWVTSENKRQHLLFLERTRDGGKYHADYKWILCVPILLGLEGPAAGVLSFASRDTISDADHQLFKIAQDWAAENPPEEVGEFCTKLITAVSTGFWSGVASCESSPKSAAKFATRTLLTLGGEAPPTPTVPPAETPSAPPVSSPPSAPPST